LFSIILNDISELLFENLTIILSSIEGESCTGPLSYSDSMNGLQEAEKEGSDRGSTSGVNYTGTMDARDTQEGGAEKGGTL
jgi:hypothetical protein